MINTFIHIRFLDVIDIFLVAILFYQLYMLIRGTVAFSITMGITAIYIFWWGVRAHGPYHPYMGRWIGWKDSICT